jgi:AhpD family alkylhydroperoxidase
MGGPPERRIPMNRDTVYKEMKEMFGLVPGFFKMVPDSTLEHEWELFKAIQLNETAIPNKYKELIGVAISAAVRCRYCSFFHTEMAKLNGATDAEVEEAVHYAKSSVGWSAYINGLQIDYDQFKDEVRRVCEYVREKQSGSRVCTSYGDWTCKEEEVPTAV